MKDKQSIAHDVSDNYTGALLLAFEESQSRHSPLAKPSDNGVANLRRG